MNFRSTTAAGVAAVLGAALLAGCGSSGPGSSDGDGGGGKLQVWVYQDASTKVQEEVVKEFNKTSDVKAVLNQIPGANYVDKLRTGMGSPSAPDVFFNWGGGSILDYVENGQVLDLGPVLDKDDALKTSFLAPVLDAGRTNGKYYGIPMRGMQPVILFYNKEVFDDAGAEVPASWDDLLSAVDRFKDEGVTPFALAGADGWPELMWIEYLVDRHGGAEVFERIQGGDASGWGDPAVLKAAETIRDLVDRGAFGRNYASVNYTEDGASTLFAKGKAAMHLMGSWEFANQLSNQKEFAETGLGWTTFPPVPGGEGDPASVVGNPTNYWSVNARTKHKDAALEFVKLSAEQSYAKSLVKNGDVPTTANASELLADHTAPEYARFQYEMVEKAPSFTLSWDQALPARVSASMLTNLQKLFNGQLSPQAFTDAMKGLK